MFIVSLQEAGSTVAPGQVLAVPLPAHPRVQAGAWHTLGATEHSLKAFKNRHRLL